jgi:N6-L-threonylcarbamoyladenine synthase
MHVQYGGVVPEIAARSHIESMLPVIEQALTDAGTTWDEIDGIAVTAGPGLLGSLLIGTLTAKTLAIAKGKPLYAVNHVVAHTYANMLIGQQVRFPLLSLSASGNHSHLLLFGGYLDYRLLGSTRDDAAGEAFDKVARILGMPYPGGPQIAKAALSGDPHAYQFPKAKLGTDTLDFSFSGLKTAVLRRCQQLAGRDYTAPSFTLAALLSKQQICDVAASFQRTAAETLVDHLVRAYEQYQPASVVIAGGVAANAVLREEASRRIPVPMHYAPMKLCTDNAAMIAALGYQHALSGLAVAPNGLETDPSLSI